MLKTILHSLFGVTLFALGAIGAWYFAQRQQQSSANTTAAAAPAHDPHAADASHTAPPTSAAVKIPVPDIPTPVKGRPSSSEELFRYSAMVRKQSAAIQEKRQLMEQEEHRLRLVNEDMQGQRKEIEGMLLQVQELLGSAQSLSKEIETKRHDIQRQQQEAGKKVDETKPEPEEKETSSQDNLQKAANLVQMMAPEKAAAMIREYSNDGKMAYAIQLLAQIEERDAAKILDAIDDTTLVAELTEMFQEMKRPKPKMKKR